VDENLLHHLTVRGIEALLPAAVPEGVPEVEVDPYRDGPVVGVARRWLVPAPDVGLGKLVGLPDRLPVTARVGIVVAGRLDVERLGGVVGRECVQRPVETLDGPVKVSRERGHPPAAIVALGARLGVVVLALDVPADEVVQTDRLGPPDGRQRPVHIAGAAVVLLHLARREVPREGRGAILGGEGLDRRCHRRRCLPVALGGATRRLGGGVLDGGLCLALRGALALVLQAAPGVTVGIGIAVGLGEQLHDGGDHVRPEVALDEDVRRLRVGVRPNVAPDRVRLRVTVEAGLLAVTHSDPPPGPDRHRHSPTRR
jgi:hypothetical protein